MKTKRKVLFLFFVFSGVHLVLSEKSFAQNLLQSYEDTLKNLGYDIMHGSNDSIRKSSNKLFLEKFETALQLEKSFDYHFDSLVTVSKLIAPDNSFRIYNWILPKQDGYHYRYFGFLQYFDKKKNQYILYALHDSTTKITAPEKAKLSCNNWYGAVYYKIIFNKKWGKQYYTLLGWKGNNKFSTKKVIDVLSFAGNKPVFGAAVFKWNKTTKHRIIFEFTAEAVMTLRYEESLKMIVFDHLSPPNPSLKDVNSTYGPDLSYDGLKFSKGKWIYVHDIDARNDNKSTKYLKRKEAEVPIYKGK